jgi:hypothetical protein
MQRCKRYNTVFWCAIWLCVLIVSFFHENHTGTCVACVSTRAYYRRTYKSVLGAFVKFRKTTISFLMCGRPSVRPHGKTGLPLDGFS